MGVLNHRLCLAILLATAGLLTHAAVPVAPARAADEVVSPPPSALNDEYPVAYRAWTGAAREAIVLVPRGYLDGPCEPLPCVIAAHGRGMTPRIVARRWGDLPTRYGCMVICAHSAARRTRCESWGAPGQIADLMRLPNAVEQALPWLRIDHARVYVAGVSMGGQEALCLAARYPDRIAGAASFDGVADLATRYSELRRSQRAGVAAQALMRREIGGSPATARHAYRIRSPLSYARTLASAGVPLVLWWSTSDLRVINQATTQTGKLSRRLLALDPAAPVTQHVTALAHGVAFCPNKGLEETLLAFRPEGEWRTVSPAPPADWTYVSAARRADVWGYRITCRSRPRGMWRIRFQADGQSVVTTPVALTLAVPHEGSQPVRVRIGACRARLTPAGGRLSIPVPRGRNIIVLVMAEG